MFLSIVSLNRLDQDQNPIPFMILTFMWLTVNSCEFQVLVWYKYQTFWCSYISLIFIRVLSNKTVFIEFRRVFLLKIFEDMSFLKSSKRGHYSVHIRIKVFSVDSVILFGCVYSRFSSFFRFGLNLWLSYILNGVITFT